MSNVDMSKFSTEDLLTDLADSDADIIVCENALRLGITEYSGGKTQHRLDVNRKIAAKIRAELARRGANA